MGCAECRALRIYRDVDTLQRIVGVDIDRQALSDNANRLTPLVSDYMFRRSKPLTVELYNGSLTDYDERLQSVEAVTLIEVSVFVLCLIFKVNLLELTYAILLPVKPHATNIIQLCLVLLPPSFSRCTETCCSQSTFFSRSLFQLLFDYHLLLRHGAVRVIIYLPNHNLLNAVFHIIGFKCVVFDIFLVCLLLVLFHWPVLYGHCICLLRKLVNISITQRL